MSHGTSLLRLARMAAALKGTEHAAKAEELYQAAYSAAHAHPRQTERLAKIFRALRDRAKQAGVWDQLAEPNNSSASLNNSAAAHLQSLIDAGGYSQRGAAKELQISERMMRYYCAGTQPIPRAVMLAMEHLVSCSPLPQSAEQK